MKAQNPKFKSHYLGAPRADPQEILTLKTALQDKIAQTNGELSAKRRLLAKKLMQLRARSRKRGYLAGLKQAQIRYLNQQQESHWRFRQLVKQANHDCLALAIKAAEEITCSTLSIDQSALIARIQRGLDALIDRHALELIVNPRQGNAVRQAFAGNRNGNRAAVEISGQIAPGNAIIKSNAGQLQLDWRSHLNAIHSTWRRRLEAVLQSKEE